MTTYIIDDVLSFRGGWEEDVFPSIKSVTFYRTQNWTCWLRNLRRNLLAGALLVLRILKLVLTIKPWLTHESHNEDLSLSFVGTTWCSRFRKIQRTKPTSSNIILWFCYLFYSCFSNRIKPIARRWNKKRIHETDVVGYVMKMDLQNLFDWQFYLRLLLGFSFSFFIFLPSPRIHQGSIYISIWIWFPFPCLFHT